MPISFPKHIMTPDLRDLWRITKRRLFQGSRFALNDLDKKLERYLDFDNGFFVELGANDGFTQSNTYYLELRRNWHGVLVEPSPNNFLKCVRHRSRNNKIFCNACVDFDYPDRFVEMAYADLMTVSESMKLEIEDTSDHLKSAEKHMKMDELSFSYGAVAAPLSDLLNLADAPAQIDFLSLDVEGAELQVLKGIDHNRYRFRFILIESRDGEKIKKYLSKFDYDFVKRLTHHDFLFSCKRSDTAMPD